MDQDRKALIGRALQPFTYVLDEENARDYLRVTGEQTRCI
jgi:hypothetical protein